MAHIVSRGNQPAQDMNQALLNRQTEIMISAEEDVRIPMPEDDRCSISKVLPKKKVLLEWVFILMNVIIELCLAVLSQEAGDSKIKGKLYRDLAAILSSVCLTLSLIEVVYEANRDEVKWQKKRGCYCFYYPGENGEIIGRFSLWFGLISAALQLSLNIASLVMKRGVLKFDCVGLLLSVGFLIAALVGEKKARAYTAVDAVAAAETVTEATADDAAARAATDAAEAATPTDATTTDATTTDAAEAATPTDAAPPTDATTTDAAEAATATDATAADAAMAATFNCNAHGDVEAEGKYGERCEGGPPPGSEVEIENHREEVAEQSQLRRRRLPGQNGVSIFVKTLSKTDVTARLAWPSRLIYRLPLSYDRHTEDVDFTVADLHRKKRNLKQKNMKTPPVLWTSRSNRKRGKEINKTG